MTATMVFVHGRGQEAKDPANLLRTWRAGLAAGLVEAGLPPLDAAPAALTYYGDLLYRITAELARSGDRIDLEAMPTRWDAPGPFHPHLTRDVGTLERQLVMEMAGAVGAQLSEEESLREAFEGVLSWGLARRALVQVARRTRLDREVITGHLQDVAVYLARARDQVLDAVRAQIPPATPIILVSHSLGTVVARDLLDDEDLRDRTVAWVTLGSPLGLPTVQRNLRTRGAHNPGVDWLSAYDVNDVVALGHPLRRDWGDPLHDVEVENRDAPHAIERYLGHREVAGFIGQAVTGQQPVPA